MRLTVADVRAAGFCINYGLREFCRRHGLDFKKAIREGFEEAELLGIKDAMLQRVIEVKRHGLQEKANGRL